MRINPLYAQFRKRITDAQRQLDSSYIKKIRIPIAIKLALAITLLIVGGMSTLGLIILENQTTVLNRLVDDMGTAFTEQFANNASELVLSDDSLGLQTLINNLVDRQQIKGAIILSDKGDPLVITGTVPALGDILMLVDDSQDARAYEWSTLENPEFTLISFHTPIMFKQLVAGNALVTFSKQHMVQSLQHSKYVIILFTVLMSLIAIFLAFIMSRHLSRPIYSLVDASKAIGEGDYLYRLNDRRNDEIGELATAFNQMAHGLLKKSQVEDVFSRFVSSNVAEEILENLDEVELGGKHVEASVLFADIVGFTSISEKMPADEVAQILNEYFSYISNIAHLHSGHIDKFMGDCAMVVFGVPNYNPEHRFNALSCAVMIRETVERLNQQRIEQGKIPIHFKIGVNAGIMVAGNLGSRDRMEYTVIGDPVNIASRLASIAKSDQIIVLEEMYKEPQIESRVIAEKHEVIRVRGKEDMVSTWLVKGIKVEHNPNMQQEIKLILEQPMKSASRQSH